MLALLLIGVVLEAVVLFSVNQIPKDLYDNPPTLKVYRDVPPVTAKVFGEVAEGKIYITNQSLYNYMQHARSADQQYSPYGQVLDKEGRTLKQFPLGDPYGMNFLPHNDGYVYAQGILNEGERTGKHITLGEKWIVTDENFKTIDVIQSVGKSNTDGHEILFLENGNYLLMIYDQKENGHISTMLQEITPAREVVWEWDSLDHVAADEVYPELTLADPDDVSHGNSMFVDTDGNLIVSFRNTSQVLKINKTTGDVIWRLGGRKNEFTYINDPLNGFSAQHHAQRLPNGNLLIFDNGNGHTPSQTRVIEYKLDEVNKTAELVWSYQIPGYFAFATGSVQQLSNGNMFIGWGIAVNPNETLRAMEITRDGKILLELHMPAGAGGYRVFKIEN